MLGALLPSCLSPLRVFFFFLSVDSAARVNSVSDPSPPIGAVRELMPDKEAQELTASPRPEHRVERQVLIAVVNKKYSSHLKGDKM